MPSTGSHTPPSRVDKSRQSSSKYGTSCVGCRRRKQKCDARTPTCSRCEKLHEPCVYEGNVRVQRPPQLVSLVSKTFSFLEDLVDASSPYSDAELRPLIRHFLESNSVNDPGHSDARYSEDQKPNIATGSFQEGTAAHSSVTAADDGGVGVGGEVEPGGTAEIDELLMHMSVADDGENGHFGVTSFHWQTPSASVIQRLQRRATKAQAQIGSTGGSDIVTWPTEASPVGEDENEAGMLRANASLLSQWENLAFAKLELEYGHANATTIIHLLRVYFSWLYAQDCVIYRPVFLRDMALGGPYYNDFLLNVICANAMNYSDIHESSRGAQPTDTIADMFVPKSDINFLDRAKSLLSREIDRPTNVPTIQGLLILGQRECACGNLSQGWMYTGMAFRAMRDIGIHLDCSRLPIFGFGTLSTEDRETRRRLFWAAFSWDKIISLALGRMPTFNAWQNISPGPIVDDTEDDDDWYPYFGSTPTDIVSYGVQKSWMTLNFRHFIRLVDIIQKIIMRLYVGRPQRLRNIQYVGEMRDRLSQWFDALPNVIKLDIDSLPEQCPPPHIFTTNALYRAAIILLYRVYLPHTLPFTLGVPSEISKAASESCTRMAEELHHLFMLYERTFKLRNMTYTLSWTMYSAATINSLDFQSSDPIISSAASRRLVYSLHVLDRGSQQTPGTKRSVDTIKQRLRMPKPTAALKRPHDATSYPDSRHRGSLSQSSTARQDNSSLLDLWQAGDPSAQDIAQLLGDLGPSSQSAISTSQYQQAPAMDSSQITTQADLDSVFLQFLGGDGTSSTDLMQGIFAMPSSANTVQYAEPDGGGVWDFEAWQ